MDFIRRLRPGVQRGEITCSIRIWKRARARRASRGDRKGERDPPRLIGTVTIKTEGDEVWGVFELQWPISF